MSKEIVRNEIICNEVIIVGKLKNADDKSVIDLTLSKEEQLKAIFAKFGFIRNTTPGAKAIEAGFQVGRFFQIQVGDPGGAKITLPNGNTVTRSRINTSPGWDTIFESNKRTTFDELKGELLSRDSNSIPNKVDIVGGDPNNGALRLKEYALMGFWDEFPLGFTHKIHKRDASGALVPLIANKKQDDGSFKPEQATTNTGRHFVYEIEVANLEGIRQNMRDQVIKWKITPTDNTTQEKGVIQDNAKTETVTADEV